MNATGPSTIDLAMALAVVILGGLGTFLLLPHRHGLTQPRALHGAGALLSALAVLVLARFWNPPGPFLSSLFFYAFGLAALGSGVVMIASRNPIYSALWFAAVVLSTTGLFLLAEAEFLAAGTIIVYAGAIIVTFLFVIMLAQSEGQATYDRMARSPGRSALTCSLLLAGLLYALVVVKSPTGGRTGAQRFAPLSYDASTAAVANQDRGNKNALAGDVIDKAMPLTVRLARTRSEKDYELGKEGVATRRADADADAAPTPRTPHTAGLGGSLYTDHLVSAEVAGVLLFIALIGALAIATPKPPIRPGDRGPTV